MTEQQATAEPQDGTQETSGAEVGQTPNDAPEAAQEPQGQPQDDGDGKPSNREAKYRRQLRDTEAERDTLAGQLSSLRRQAAEDAIGDVLEKPASFWMTGADVNDFIRDDGTLDVGALREAAETARDDAGLARHQRFKGSVDAGVATSSAPKPDPWTGAFKGR